VHKEDAHSPENVMNKKKLVFIVCLIVCVLVLVIYFVAYKGGVKSLRSVTVDQEVAYPVARIVDGDTFKVRVEEKEVTVRMLGINTPETVDPRKQAECYGKESSNKLKSLLEGRKVTLKLNPRREATDKFGRYLVYVYRDDGLFINESLIRGGFAREYTYDSAYTEQMNFRTIENVAQQANAGLWGACKIVY
jgi:micrococcal nuclease